MKNTPLEETTKQPLGATWYRLPSYGHDIGEYTVIKSTSQTVWFKDKDWNGKEIASVRQARKGSDWHPTKDAAIDELLKRAERKLEYTKGQYSFAGSKLAELKLKYGR